ncbi:TPA: hypothetical protein HA318_00815 [Candidatus Micrarchaeota archaeon]|nr:hypothetical protein [Candidatus Micrarchaeota archaeon]
MLWAVILGLIASYAGIEFGFIEPVFQQSAAAVTPLLLISMGLYFQPGSTA